MTDYERLMAKTTIIGSCLIFTGSINKVSGYGSFRYQGKTSNAHKASYEIHKGKVPIGKVVMHTCDNRKCVNPSHLILGTQTDNLQDMARKGRSKSQLTNEQVKAIREDSRSCSKIALDYNVHRSTINKIKSGINRRYS